MHTDIFIIYITITYNTFKLINKDASIMIAKVFTDMRDHKRVLLSVMAN